MSSFKINTFPISGIQNDFIAMDKTYNSSLAAAGLSINGAYCPSISRVITNVQTTKSSPVVKDGKQVMDKNGNPKYERVQLERPVHTTVVEFIDGTKCIMKCSSIDKPDTELAVVNAIVKRVFGKPNDDIHSKSYGVVDGNGVGLALKKIVESAWDQPKMEAKIKADKAAAKLAHQKRQQAEHEAAEKRKIQRAASKIQTYVKALESLGLVVVDPNGIAGQPNGNATASAKPATTCACSKTASKCSCSSGQPTDGKYVRPNKKFSEFTQDEKRAYWRWCNAKRK